jgi:type IV pilus assembly protein PilQ
MSMSPRTLIAAVVALASTTLAPIAYADGKNEIRAVTFDESSGMTNVHVRGADTPTFTVYKLERPTRVVIDIPQARLSDAMRSHDSAAVFTPNTWAVSTIAAQQLDENAVRVVVTMARPGHYDVKTVGHEVVVMVMPRDAAPKTTNPEDLVRAQQQASAAETARAAAQQQADAANATAKQSHAEAEAAKADAERLRKTAADQVAKAEAAQRAVDQAKHASAADLEAAKAIAAKAKQDSEAAKTAAASAQLEAERTRRAADKAKQDALAEASAAKAEAAKAHGEAAEAQQALAQTRAEADLAKADAAKQTREAREQLAAAQREVANAKSEAAKRAAEADAAQKQAVAARAEAQQRVIEANAARDQTASAKAEAAANANAAHAAKTESQQAHDQIVAAKAEAVSAKADAARARHEAELAKSDAETARVTAAADKKKAESARGEAERMMKDAKTQLATLDQKMASTQSLEDKARAASAAAQAREEAARDAEAKATKERVAAELAAKQAQDAQTKVAASERAKAAADAKSAEDRLAQARRATDEAEQQRRAAQTAAATAKHELEQTRTTLATVEQQRSSAIAAATDAARKRSDAEAAASDATRRRGEAETAAADAAKQKKAAELAAGDAMQKKTQAERERAEAEAQRVAALDAAKSAQVARDAADKQRKVAEKAAQTAVAAKTSAEDSLAELTAKQKAAEHAAADLEARSKAEAKAQAQVAAMAAAQTAQTRKASDQELAKAKAELAKLSADRTHAEGELADRRKAVALQQAEAARLETAASQAHDAASREESRRAQLAQKRSAEEAELAKLATAKADAEAAKREVVAAKAEAEKVRAQVRVAEAAKPAKVEKPAKADKSGERPTRSGAEGGAKVNDKLAKVTAIDFKGDDGNGQVSIAVDGGVEVQVGEVTATHAELIVDNAELAQKLERTLDVSKFGSPVRTVSSFRDRHTPNRVRLVAELAQAATPTVERDGNAVRWHFIGNEIAKRPVKVTNVPSPVVGGFGAASTPLGSQTVTQLPPQGGKRRVYHGAVVDLDVKDAPLHDLLRLLADTGHISIVVPESIDPKITVKLKRVPWDQALEVILQSYGLWYRRDGTIFRVASQKDLDTEDAAEAARRDAAIKSESPRVERVNLNYASAAELKPTLETMMSPHGKIEVDARTNALIISDVAANRAEMVRLAYELDTQTPQISIEARIVEARSTFLREIGVQWGGNAIAGAAGGNATGLIWPSNVAVTGANTDAATISTGVASPSDFAVNLPAATGAGEGGALGFSLGSIGGNFNINLRLSALEDSGNVRIISAPKITVLNNKLASISQGVSIPISVVSAAGTNTQFVQADLKLEVTPSVSQRDCAIAMTLNVTKNEPDFVNVGARGDPTILRKEAHTQMLVADGETTVLGGIYTRNAGVAYKKIPLFGDIPVLGWLFKNRRENDDRTEILVFITPKITNRGSLPCVK